MFITHDFDEALRLADRIAIMKDGIIEQLDTPDNIVLNPATEYVKKFTEDVPREKVLKIESIMATYEPAIAGSNTVSKDAIIETVAESILDSKENLTVIGAKWLFDNQDFPPDETYNPSTDPQLQGYEDFSHLFMFLYLVLMCVFLCIVSLLAFLFY